MLTQPTQAPRAPAMVAPPFDPKLLGLPEPGEGETMNSEMKRVDPKTVKHEMWGNRCILKRDDGTIAGIDYIEFLAGTTYGYPLRYKQADSYRECMINMCQREGLVEVCQVRTVPLHNDMWCHLLHV